MNTQTADRAWNIIQGHADLARARKVLSVHEFRQIVGIIGTAMEMQSCDKCGAEWTANEKVACPVTRSALMGRYEIERAAGLHDTSDPGCRPG